MIKEETINEALEEMEWIMYNMISKYGEDVIKEALERGTEE